MARVVRGGPEAAWVLRSHTCRQCRFLLSERGRFCACFRERARLVGFIACDAGRLLRLCVAFGRGALGLLIACRVLQAQALGLLPRLVGIAAAGFQQDAIVFAVELFELPFGEVRLGCEPRRGDPALGGVHGLRALHRVRGSLRKLIERLVRLEPVDVAELAERRIRLELRELARQALQVRILGRIARSRRLYRDQRRKEQGCANRQAAHFNGSCSSRRRRRVALSSVLSTTADCAARARPLACARSASASAAATSMRARS
jgi:hypothetical protein